MGEGSDHITKAIESGKLNNIKEYIDLSDLEVDELIKELYSLTKDRVMFGVGNIQHMVHYPQLNIHHMV